MSNYTKDQFKSTAGSSVITSRNFGLLRGVDLRDSVKILQTYAKHKNSGSPSQKNQDESSVAEKRSDDEEDTTVRKIPILERQNAFSIGSTAFAGACNKSATTWDWPLGNPEVKNDDDRFEVKLKISPFQANEVSVYISGNELIVRCAKNQAGNDRAGQIYRSYTLPLNVDPRSAQFVVTHSGYVRISIPKEQPLKMAVAYVEPLEQTMNKLDIKD